MGKRCKQCGTPMATRRAGSVFCEPKCRAKFNRHGGVPKELRRIPRWVGWKPVTRSGKTTKVPMNVRGGYARVDNPATWTTFEEARARFGDRIGFVLADTDEVSCVDLDDCVTDGVLSDAARAVIEATPDKFLVEYSPSGNGIHIWCYSGNSAGTNRVENGVRVERYSHSRYMTVTGMRVML